VILYAGTSNLGKLREFKLGASDFDIRTVELPPPEEQGETFEETARQKALYYATHLTDFVFADDSGLEVDALGGGPGVHSARFAGPNANDAANNALLLERMRGISNRTARFVCVIALVRNRKVERTFRGSVEGRIIDPSRGEKPRGANGFGYDPLFFHEPFGCTFGEAASEEKMRVSHRGQALEAMLTYLRGIAST
jgi:XTP/dITP diphosphohydrolase